jgi:DNA-binding response OmpR family regulator
MARPTFLVAEPEPEEGVSARKLVLETAKFNVITAYSTKEALEHLERFPSIDAVILHCRLLDKPSVIADVAKKQNKKRKVIALSPQAAKVKQADYHLSSHEPQELLNLVRKLYGDPRDAAPAARLGRP